MDDFLGALRTATTTEEIMGILAATRPPADPFARAQVRQGIIDALEDGGLVKTKARVADGWLKQVKEKRTGAEETTGGRPLEFDDPDPWPDPVDGDQLLQDLARVFGRYTVMPSGGYTAAALWVVYTYVFDAFDVSPMLALTSAEMDSGKSTVCDLLDRLVYRPVSTSNIRPATLFRTIEAYGPTIIADEVDAWNLDDDMRGILNSGWKRRRSNAIRLTGEEYEPRQFSTWAPKAVAAIATLPPTIDSRSILIRMVRKSVTEHVQPLRERDAYLLEQIPRLRSRMVRWAADHFDDLAAATPPPAGFHNRREDNWEPLLAIADAAGGIHPERARAAARVLESGRERPSLNAMLLADVRDIFGDPPVGRVGTEELVERLKELPNRPWTTLGKNRDRPLTVQRLGQMLGAFNVHPDAIRTPRGYTYEGSLKEMVERYVGDVEMLDNPEPSAGHPGHVAGETATSRAFLGRIGDGS